MLETRVRPPCSPFQHGERKTGAESEVRAQYRHSAQPYVCLDALSWRYVTLYRLTTAGGSPQRRLIVGAAVVVPTISQADADQAVLP